jgi:sugar lactone lactonase YvrE
MKKFPGILSVIKLTLLGICVLASIHACKKDVQQSPPPPPPPPPAITISSISPTGGPFSTVVTITGSGFNPNAASDSVKFNGVGAAVQQASATQLKVLVPKMAGTGPIIVQAGGQTATGPIFTFSYTVMVSSFAGGKADGFADGTDSAAHFLRPVGLATDIQGNIYVADVLNNRIRKVTQLRVVSTLAGSGTQGFADGNGSIAQFNLPFGVATDPQGNIYVADANNYRIRKITPSSVVSTLAGSGTLGFADGSGSAAQFNAATGVATDAQGNVYVADAGNNCIRKISSAGAVTTLAGSSTAGFVDGNGNAAQFNYPTGVATDAQANIYVADNHNHCIRKITPAGIVSTLAGNGNPGLADGIGNASQFNYPYGVATDARGNIYVTDEYNNCIRIINPSGTVSTLAGSSVAGVANGSGSIAKFGFPRGVATDAQGNIYVDDIENKIRLITVQ